MGPDFRQCLIVNLLLIFLFGNLILVIIWYVICTWSHVYKIHICQFSILIFTLSSVTFPLYFLFCSLCSTFYCLTYSILLYFRLHVFSFSNLFSAYSTSFFVFNSIFYSTFYYISYHHIFCSVFCSIFC